MDMDTSKDSWNACLQYRNKQLTKQLKDYQKVSALTKCSSSLIVAMGQLLCLHQKPSYGIVKDEAEWRALFIVIDLFYGGVSVRRIDVIWFKCPGVEVMLSDTGPFG